MQDILRAEAFPRQITPKQPHRRIQRAEIYEGIERRAAADGFELSDERMEVIDFVLDFYEHCEDCRNARQLMRVLRQAFAQRGGAKYLYRLFPDGPLSTIHELADLPDLRYQVDRGFGTTY